VNEAVLAQLNTLHVDLATLPHMTAIFNLPAVIIVAFVTTMLVIGIRESAGLNNIIVMVKLAVVVLFIVGAIHAINPANWHPFVPENAHVWGKFGWSGVMRGASLVFFAYIGFDAVSTAAQEAKNPQRDMPIGIIGSLILCTVLYILVSAIATGVVPYAQLDVPEPIALAADRANLGWMARFIKVGVIAGLSSVILVMMLGQTRVFWTMSRDGLLPPFVSRVHPRFKTPWIITIATGIVVAFFGGWMRVADAGNLCNIGTLLAFVIVSLGVLILRVREPELPRKFKVPLVWVVAPLGALSALTLMAFLPLTTWIRLGVWFAIGMLLYFAYGIRRSKLAQPPPPNGKP
jgi:APA family basic amino acid/polyamine antiporter